MAVPSRNHPFTRCCAGMSATKHPGEVWPRRYSQCVMVTRRMPRVTATYEAPFLRGVAIVGRKSPSLPRRQEHVAEFQPLALVQRHQPHPPVLILVRAAGGQRRMVEQFARGVEAARELDQLL